MATERDGAAQPQKPAQASDTEAQDTLAMEQDRTSRDADRLRSTTSTEDSTTVNNGSKAAAQTSDPPLPDEEAPPLPDEAPPEDDGWTHLWDNSANAWYFFNRFTGKSQWENPRVPAANIASYGSYDRSMSGSTAPATSSGAPGTSSPPKRKYGGYNPAIHGDYDPNADYAQEAQREEEAEEAAAAAAAGLPNPIHQDYSTTAHFNRFTGRFQNAGMNPDYHNDENKSKRQMSAFFDVDAAANSHDGRSLKAERRGKTLSKKELKAFKDKRRDKKEEKRRAWLRD